MSHRFFKTTREVYDAARSGLDAAFGHPNGKADTCMPPEPPTTEGGKVLVAILTAMTEWPEVALLIESMLTSGDVTEITSEEYHSHIPDSIV